MGHRTDCHGEDMKCAPKGSCAEGLLPSWWYHTEVIGSLMDKSIDEFLVGWIVRRWGWLEEVGHPRSAFEGYILS
jgi:hypothetical protein